MMSLMSGLRLLTVMMMTMTMMITMMTTMKLMMMERMDLVDLLVRSIILLNNHILHNLDNVTTLVVVVGLMVVVEGLVLVVLAGWGLVIVVLVVDLVSSIKKNSKPN